MGVWKFSGECFIVIHCKVGKVRKLIFLENWKHILYGMGSVNYRRKILWLYANENSSDWEMAKSFRGIMLELSFYIAVKISQRRSHCGNWTFWHFILKLMISCEKAKYVCKMMEGNGSDIVTCHVFLIGREDVRNATCFSKGCAACLLVISGK